VEFWANGAQLDAAVRAAKKTFARRLYGDIESLVYEVIQEAHNGNREAILAVCEMLLDEIRVED
jgi:hypothetical protein